MHTSAVTLASRRAATSSCVRVSRNGAPARMSLTIRAGGSSAAAGVGIRSPSRCDVRIATLLVWQAAESGVRRLLFSADGGEGRLPAPPPPPPAEQGTEQHRDPPGLSRGPRGPCPGLGLL